MKWNKLPEKKPPFMLALVLWFKEDGWIDGTLDEVRHTKVGEQFLFKDNQGDPIVTEITHWAIPTKPKE